MQKPSKKIQNLYINRGQGLVVLTTTTRLNRCTVNKLISKTLNKKQKKEQEIYNFMAQAIVSPSKPRKPSNPLHNSSSYYKSLSRAFNHAKRHIFFNPDMNTFITFTYSGSSHSPQDVLQDIKVFILREKRERERMIRVHRDKDLSTCNHVDKFVPAEHNTATGHTLSQGDMASESYRKKERVAAQHKNSVPFKYAYVMEYQKRGSIHVHMIATDCFSTQVNKFGYLELKNWTHGYTNVQRLAQFDNNFRPFLYLFKYMFKSERIGKTFIHMSRNLNNYEKIDGSDITDLEMEEIFRENMSIDIGNGFIEFEKKYGFVKSLK